MDERTKILLCNAIDYIHEQKGFDYDEIAKTVLGMTDEEWQEIAHEYKEEE